MSVTTGLDRIAAGDGPKLSGRRVAVLCHAASVDARLHHIRDILERRGAVLASLLGPEHGVDAAAQDMEGVEEAAAAVPTYSLYGDTVESLWPTPQMFEGADVVVCDLQDVGARYYTYVWTMAMVAEVALKAGLEVVILDRPNPLGGLDAWVEGGAIETGQESFVGWHDVPSRHGLTAGEIVSLALSERGCDIRRLDVVECGDWRRGQQFQDTGLPWVMPSPNMPALDTAFVYPGQCLFEGTLLSEGRGTTRPFELWGAPWVCREQLMAELNPEDFPGLGLRPVMFRPMFHKHVGEDCEGVALHVLDRSAVRSVRASWALLRGLKRLWPTEFRWRTERYEFVDDRPAIDLLAGGAWLRDAVEAGTSVAELLDREEDGRRRFLTRRKPFLRYVD